MEQVRARHAGEEALKGPHERPSKSLSARKGAKPTTEIDTQGYSTFVSDLKRKIAEAGHRVGLYWNIGRDILARQERDGWGAKIIDRLADDLGRASLRWPGRPPET
ncbi:DUF1016 N-terminal domain-containing protein [Bradyrhizobium iriomotense]|uniref:DUF1016 N-terminal domain-containing protein n=1 Tax=Bradyrhizobium iriomotense TaxID=441950 RepID=UPI0024E0EBBC|nr:DUF1016 N-terminal domain-containing protein [Bradyrhizobium iriomotense]